ncbi:tyrosine-type recombinase/integrase [Microbulbifer agarilyticus]|uniref:tyrosine-type recombinase/integrase n=1 Tax=Microbulbifer agarilyticus TaxID=260552 RepID=UPI001C96B9A6|nr:tyrosine-type recombinase/integrase [Microbulbifer agarilyticus]MBY6212379.1 tyrosine-type recombinase/integrase [Microbulbifer agarilyticus]
MRLYQGRRGDSDSFKDLSAYRLMLPHLGKVPLDLLDTLVLERYVEVRHEHSKPSTIERDLTRVRAILRFAAKKGLVSAARVADNLASVSDLVGEYDDQRMRWLEQGQRDELINWFKFDAELHLILHILMLSGLRLGECLRLAPADFTGAGIQTWSIKGRGRKRRHRTVPLHPRIRQLLSHYPLRSSERMFCMSETTLRRYFTEACERLGINDFRIHDCRHTYAVHLRLAGADIDEIAKLLGHTNIETASRYANIVPARVSALTGRL